MFRNKLKRAVLTLAIAASGLVTVATASPVATGAPAELTADFCVNLSLGGPRTFPFDSDGDGSADVCSLPYTRREAVARQNALEALAARFSAEFSGLVRDACRVRQSADFDDSADDLAADACSTGSLSPLPDDPPAGGRFYSGAVSGPDFCLDFSLGGARTFPFDSNGDGVADVCSLPYSRREAVARQGAYDLLAKLYFNDFMLRLGEACAAVVASGVAFDDDPSDLAEDECQPAQTPPPSGGGGGGGGAPPPSGGGAPPPSGGGGGGGGGGSTPPPVPTSEIEVTLDPEPDAVVVTWTEPQDADTNPPNGYEVE